MKTRSSSDRLIESYLSELTQALTSLKASRRREIVEEVSGHIADGRALLDSDDEAGLRALLDRVGEPEAIAAEAGAADTSTSARRGDAWVPWLLLAGGFAFVVGWFVGVGLLWSSATWRLRDKLLGTLVWPGGLFALFVLPGLAFSVAARSSPAVQAVPAAPRSAHGAQQLVPVPPHALAHSTTVSVAPALSLGLVIIVVALIAQLLVVIHLERVRRRA